MQGVAQSLGAYRAFTRLSCNLSSDAQIQVTLLGPFDAWRYFVVLPLGHQLPRVI